MRFLLLTTIVTLGAYYLGAAVLDTYLGGWIFGGIGMIPVIVHAHLKGV